MRGMSTRHCLVYVGMFIAAYMRIYADDDINASSQIVVWHTLLKSLLLSILSLLLKCTKLV